MTPAVTVLLPVYNGMPYLPSSIESILTQSLSDFELLILDDCSTDNSWSCIEAIRDPRVRKVRNDRNMGLANSLTKGLSLAQAPLIARQDQDDLSVPHRLATQKDFLEAHPDVAVVGSEAVSMDARGVCGPRLLRPLTPRSIAWHLCFENSMIHSALMFRREIALERCGGYHDIFKAEDYDLWSRLAASEKLQNLPEPLIQYRLHETSMMGSVSDANRERYFAALAPITRRCLHRIFPGREFSDDTVRTIALQRITPNAEVARKFRVLVDDLASAYQDELANDAERQDFRRTRALLLHGLAYRLAEVDRWQAISLMWEVYRLDRDIFRQTAWVRWLALLVVGPTARAVYQKTQQATRTPQN